MITDKSRLCKLEFNGKFGVVSPLSLPFVVAMLLEPYFLSLSLSLSSNFQLVRPILVSKPEGPARERRRKSPELLLRAC